MIILGVDPGIAITGFGLIEENAQGQLISIEYGVFRTDAKLTQSERLVSLHQQLDAFLFLHSPHSCAVEKLFFQKNVKTATNVGEARGVILLALMQHGLLPAEYTPNEIKQSVCGYGGASKEQIKVMVKTILHLEELPTPDDAADALATAITHHSRDHFNAIISNADGK